MEALISTICPFGWVNSLICYHMLKESYQKRFGLIVWVNVFDLTEEILTKRSEDDNH